MPKRPTSAGPAHERRFIASLAHGLAVLELLAERGPEMALADLSRGVHLSKPTTWRLVHTLVKLGYVRQDPETKRFGMSPRILTLGALFEGMDLKDLAAPFLRDLSTRIGETVNMAVLDGDQIIYIERVKTPQVVNINLHVGSRLPVYNTSMGRALIAYKPEEWLAGYLARLADDPAGRKYAEHDGRLLREALSESRLRGYALNDEELALGLRSVASPVWSANSPLPVAAVNVAVPSVRVSTRELRTAYVPELLQTTQQISAALGYRGVTAGADQPRRRPAPLAVAAPPTTGRTGRRRAR